MYFQVRSLPFILLPLAYAATAATPPPPPSLSDATAAAESARPPPPSPPPLHRAAFQHRHAHVTEHTHKECFLQP